MSEERKCCADCGLFKPLDQYQKNHRCLDGHNNVCKSCHGLILIGTPVDRDWFHAEQVRRLAAKQIQFLRRTA